MMLMMKLMTTINDDNDDHRYVTWYISMGIVDNVIREQAKRTIYIFRSAKRQTERIQRNEHESLLVNHICIAHMHVC